MEKGLELGPCPDNNTDNGLDKRACSLSESALSPAPYVIHDADMLLQQPQWMGSMVIDSIVLKTVAVSAQTELSQGINNMGAFYCCC